MPPSPSPSSIFPIVFGCPLPFPPPPCSREPVSFAHRVPPRPSFSSCGSPSSAYPEYLDSTPTQSIYYFLPHDARCSESSNIPDVISLVGQPIVVIMVAYADRSPRPKQRNNRADRGLNAPASSPVETSLYQRMRLSPDLYQAPKVRSSVRRCAVRILL